MDVRFELNGTAFVWDDGKAHLNIAAHDGITFELGVDVFFDSFVEVQPQRERFELMAKTFEPETGSAGEGETVSIGARFGESPLGGSRFE